MAAPFARGIDWHPAHNDRQTGHAAPAASRGASRRVMEKVSENARSPALWPAAWLSAPHLTGRF